MPYWGHHCLISKLTWLRCYREHESVAKRNSNNTPLPSLAHEWGVWTLCLHLPSLGSPLPGGSGWIIRARLILVIIPLLCVVPTWSVGKPELLVRPLGLVSCPLYYSLFSLRYPSFESLFSFILLFPCKNTLFYIPLVRELHSFLTHTEWNSDFSAWLNCQILNRRFIDEN